MLKCFLESAGRRKEMVSGEEGKEKKEGGGNRRGRRQAWESGAGEGGRREREGRKWRGSSSFVGEACRST